MLLPYLVIAPSEKGGRGVFTTKNIPANTTIEISPVIQLTTKDRKQIEGTKLYHYIFEWGASRKQACMALGYVSMYNHSYEPNCEYEQDYAEGLMTIRTIKPVKKGEELCFSYNGNPDDKTPLWFKTK
ncbi:SET domain-containing protein [Aridibaculum aurantiacum]|uniref:SET domain-containing protein n=1 Tax=Aridibaculum aurantiacum TaxID=2810307 RepID=UPI001A97172F|nr:SET domain-containing protein [Aridibaculum aurantiacum]